MSGVHVSLAPYRNLGFRVCAQIDPMFQKMAASFDEGSTAGVFLSTLHCHDYRSELLFPSDAQALSTGGPPEMPDLGCVEMTDLKGESTWHPSPEHVGHQRRFP